MTQFFEIFFYLITSINLNKAVFSKVSHLHWRIRSRVDYSGSAPDSGVPSTGLRGIQEFSNRLETGEFGDRTVEGTRDRTRVKRFFPGTSGNRCASFLALQAANFFWLSDPIRCFRFTMSSNDQK